MEVRDNVVEAFICANEALRFSRGENGKAWFRRGCVFEKMRDWRNAERDYDEALKRAPDDEIITKRRGEITEKASKMAENMYYGRHRELDEYIDMLRLGER